MDRLKMILSLIMLLMSIACTPKDTLKKEESVFILDICVGDVKISHDEGKSWLFPESGMTLVENAMIKTGKDSYCDIVMPNRGIFRIAGNTTILLKSLKNELESLRVSKGKVLVNIFEPLKKGEKFTVETTAAVVAVRGTEFSVRTDGIKTTTYVKKGTVVVKKNIEVKETDLVSKEEAEKYLEVPVSENEEFETDIKDNKLIEDRINKEIEIVSNKSRLKEAFSKINRDSLKRIRRVKVIDKDFKEIGDKERQKKIRREWERIQKEIERDRQYLNKRIEEIKQKAGNRGIADKKVSEEETTAKKDISDRVLDKKIEELRKKRDEYKKAKEQEGKNEKEESLRERLKSRFQDLK